MTERQANRRFAPFALRLVAVGLDLGIVLVAAAVVRYYAIPDLQLLPWAGRMLLAAALLAYFVAGCASPLQATPGQFVLGLRIVDERGRRLGPARAALRSATLVALTAGCYLAWQMPSRPTTVAVAVACYAALFLAAVSPLRQGLHDIVAGSLVLRRRALGSDPARWARERPPVRSVLLSLLVLAVPVYGLTAIALIVNDRDMAFRTNYAVTETGVLQTTVEYFHAEHGRLPADHVELDIPKSHRYPDGGYFELMSDGVIEIHFEVRPELRDGVIILTPVTSPDGLEWRCHAEGGIVPQHLPSRCRE